MTFSEVGFDSYACPSNPERMSRPEVSFVGAACPETLCGFMCPSQKAAEPRFQATLQHSSIPHSTIFDLSSTSYLPGSDSNLVPPLLQKLKRSGRMHGGMICVVEELANQQNSFSVQVDIPSCGLFAISVH